MLSEVALAESAAAKGELAISAAAHAYYHPSAAPQSTEPKPGSILACGCTCLTHGCYSVSSAAFSFTDVQMMLHDLQSANTAANSNQKYKRTVLTNNSTRKKVTDILIKDINAAFDTIRKTAANVFLPELNIELDVEVSQLYSLSDLVSTCLLKYFYIFTVQLLSNWILKHIHEAVRVDIKVIVDSNRASMSLPTLYEVSNKSSHQILRTMTEVVTEITGDASANGSVALACMSNDDTKVSTFSAELRNVIILFITFGSTSNLELSMDSSSSSKNAMLKGKMETFHFLSRTTNEYMQDTSTLQTYNGYMTLLVKLLCKYNGQLRQFIIDDKGIVGIGTFGLHNAVNYDNAAQAIEVAKVIIDQFQLLYNLQVGIGITSGRNYCGLVGSPWRCEYSVMGPSTNLAARLMVRANNISVEQIMQFIETKASENNNAVSQYDKDNINLSVLCDESIQTRDRTHEFAHLGTIQAKGYVLPVHIYAPMQNLVTVVSKLYNVAEGEDDKLEEKDKVVGLVTRSKSSTPRACGMRKQRKQSLLKSSFYTDIQSALQESFLQSNSNKDRKSLLASKKSGASSLYGRNAELQRVLKYLFYYLLDQRVTFSVDVHAGKEASEPDVFTTSFKCLAINIAGPHGIGKTAFLYEVLRLLKQVPVHGESISLWQKNMFTSLYDNMESSSANGRSASTDLSGIKRRLNLKIVHRKLSNYTSTEPFFAWKSLLRKLMYHLLETKYQHLFGASTATPSNAENFYLKFNQVIYDFLKEKFSDEVDSFLSLLSLVGLNLMSVSTRGGDTAPVATSKVPAMILVGFAGFLCKVIQVLVNETGYIILAAL
ncbi:adenylate/guanylate cyclase domain-containing protein [archaeon]|nr:MAG: adenylate/guanylate cyclase domain-containing protein [archaeon]